MTDAEHQHGSSARRGHLRRYQWRPGESGNPRGRRPGRSLTDYLERFGRLKAARVPGVGELAAGLGLDANKATIAEVVALHLWQDAAGGNLTATRTILERLHGVPVASDVLLRLGSIEMELQKLGMGRK